MEHTAARRAPYVDRSGREGKVIRQKLAVCLLLALLVGMCAPTRVQAASIDFFDVAVYADEGDLHVEYDNGQPVDEFVNAGDLMPGDTVRRSFVITSKISQPYRLTLSAQDLESDPADFVNIIMLTLHLDGQLIYDGRLGGGLDSAGQPQANLIDLGSVSPQDAHTLQATFHLPGNELDNRYIRAHARVKWILQAQQEVASSSSDPSSSSSQPGPGPSSSGSHPSSSSRPTSPGASWTPPNSGSRTPPAFGGLPADPAPSLSLAPANPGQTQAAVDGEQVPLGGFGWSHTWSLLNLLMALTALAIAVALVVLLFRSEWKKRQYENQAEDYRQRLMNEADDPRGLEEDEPQNVRRKIILRVLAILSGIIPGILFLIWEDISLPMVFINRWTPWIGLAFGLHLLIWLAFAALARRDRTTDGDEPEEA